MARQDYPPKRYALENILCVARIEDGIGDRMLIRFNDDRAETAEEQQQQQQPPRSLLLVYHGDGGGEELSEAEIRRGFSEFSWSRPDDVLELFDSYAYCRTAFPERRKVKVSCMLNYFDLSPCTGLTVDANDISATSEARHHLQCLWQLVLHMREQS